MFIAYKNYVDTELQFNPNHHCKRFLIMNRYMNQYPFLSLLGDDYKYTPPIKEDRTVVIESTGVSKRII